MCLATTCKQLHHHPKQPRPLATLITSNFLPERNANNQPATPTLPLPSPLLVHLLSETNLPFHHQWPHAEKHIKIQELPPNHLGKPTIFITGKAKRAFWPRNQQQQNHQKIPIVDLLFISSHPSYLPKDYINENNIENFQVWSVTLDPVGWKQEVPNLMPLSQRPLSLLLRPFVLWLCLIVATINRLKCGHVSSWTKMLTLTLFFEYSATFRALDQIRHLFTYITDCNCQLKQPQYIDDHFLIVFSLYVPNNEHM